MEEKRIIPVGRVPFNYRYFDLYSVRYFNRGRQQYLCLNNLSYFAEQFLQEILETIEKERDCVTFRRGTSLYIVRNYTFIGDDWVWDDIWWLWTLDRFCVLLSENEPHGQAGPSVWRML